jgi:hypothetical protein
LFTIIYKNGKRKYKIVVIWKEDTCFVRHHPDSPYKNSEPNIKGMLGFLVDNIYVVFGDQVFQQSVGRYVKGILREILEVNYVCSIFSSLFIIKDQITSMKLFFISTT